MPDPFTARQLVTEAIVVETEKLRLETPAVVHFAKLYGSCGANCLAYHDESVLLSQTQNDPPFRVPGFGHNPFSRAMCTIQCYGIMFSYIEGADPDVLKNLYGEWGLNAQALNIDIAFLVGLGNFDLLRERAEASDYDPLLMGQIVAGQILVPQVTNSDGWNAYGDLVYDSTSDSAVRCTASCGRYADTIGYFPRNNPGPGRPDADKYVVNGTDMLWQPLLESDSNGYFSRQQHVTPHIGFTVSPDLRPYKTIPPPDYDYRQEALLVVDRLRETAGNQDRKKKIVFFDNKLYVRFLLQTATRIQYSDSFSFEDELLYLHGIDLGESDALLQAWREKVRYDLVRPTTVIQRWGDDKIDTYDGNRNHKSSKIISARDFQAFIRVMPHSEYPSGSACLCTSYSEFHVAYANGTGRQPLVNMTFGPGGISPLYCQDDPTGYGCKDEDEISSEDLDDYSRQCGESRLWGGMHFTASVTRANDVCSGLGMLAFERIVVLQNNSDFGTTYLAGDPLPDISLCSSQNNTAP